jgi:hypothetical protein
MHSDIKKRRSFLALLFAAGDARRYGDYQSKPLHSNSTLHSGQIAVHSKAAWALTLQSS